MPLLSFVAACFVSANSAGRSHTWSRKSTIEIKSISASMSPNATTPKDDSGVSSERTSSMHSTHHLQPPYPQTLKISQIHGDRGNFPKTQAFPQPHTGSTGRSSSEVSADKSAAYLSVRRAWGKTTQGDCRSSAAGYSPMSSWEHGAVLGEPWNGVGEVVAGATSGEHSVRWSHPRIINQRRTATALPRVAPRPPTQHLKLE